MSKRPKGYWTEERVREEATKYDTKAEFKRGCESAYDAARRRFPGLLDDLFENQLRSWDEAAIRTEARKYGTKKDFERGCVSAYNAALRLVLLDDLFENQLRSWDESAIRTEAARYSTKKDFQRGCESAYQAALQRFPGLLDTLGFIPGDRSDNDTIYIWRAVGHFHQGVPVFKIGVTSARLGDRRIRQCARDGGFTAALVAMVPTWLPADYVEDHLHEIGTDPGWRGFDGATEYRALDAGELEQVLHLMNGYACPGEEGVPGHVLT